MRIRSAESPLNGVLCMQFGSGWAWLVSDKAGKLSITKTPNAVLPVVEGKTPVLTCDVWEVSVPRQKLDCNSAAHKVPLPPPYPYLSPFH